MNDISHFLLSLFLKSFTVPNYVFDLRCDLPLLRQKSLKVYNSGRVYLFTHRFAIAFKFDECMYP